MPATYAHYRFGMQLLPQLPPQVRRSVDRFPSLYQVGFHGPDPFYFYSPLSRTRIGGLGDRYHHAAGRLLFEEAAQQLHFQLSDGTAAYLCGVLTHFCLDRLCHPKINGWAAEGLAAHSEIEAEFDRYLLEKDGRTPPHTQPIGAHLHLSHAELACAAAVYDHVRPGQLGRSLTNMRVVVQLAQAQEGWRRRAASRILALAGETGLSFVMHPRPNPRCNWANAPLESLYQQALLDFPPMLQALLDYFGEKKPLGPEFDLIFG